MVLVVLFLIASSATQGSGNFTCVINSHCERHQCEEKGCVLGCEHGYYGRYCTNPCSSSCKDNKCIDQGHCAGECVDRKWGITCGLDCLSKCKRCNKSDGSLCTSCKEFEYGPRCSRTCRDTCPRTGCNMNGTCVQSCFHGATEDCVTSCGIGCKTCNDVTGCDACQENFRGPDCDIYCISCMGNCTAEGCINGCKKGYFGKQCESRCNTNCENEICYQKSGNCTDGCKREYYGPRCGSRCNEHCKGGVCDRKTGKCSNGCSGGFYGEHCRIPCTNCEENNCHSVSGECAYGCSKGFFGKKCIKPCNCSSGYCMRFDGTCYTPDTTPLMEDDASTRQVIYSVVGGCGIVTVIIIVCVVIFRWCKRGSTNSNRRSEKRKNMSLPSTPAQTHEYSYIDEEGRIQSCQSVDRDTREIQQLLNNSSHPFELPSVNSSSVFENASLYNTRLNQMEIHDENFSGQDSAFSINTNHSETEPPKMGVVSSLEQEFDRKNQHFNNEVLGNKYLFPTTSDEPDELLVQ